MAVAHKMATAEFFAELVAISPLSFRPPLINKLAIFLIFLVKFLNIYRDFSDFLDNLTIPYLIIFFNHDFYKLFAGGDNLRIFVS